LSNTPLTVIVKKIRREAAEILSFELMHTQGQPLPPFTPGAHIDVHMPGGPTRQYSLCNGPSRDGSYLIAIKKEPMSRGGSAAMHERIKEGDVLTISEPRNHFPLEWSARHHLLLAAGIGITPILSMARHLQAAGAPFQLHYFTRSPEHTAFREQLADCAFSGSVAFHYGFEPDALGEYLHTLLKSRPEGGHLYFCGPRPFMDLVAATVKPTWPAESLHLEYFAAEPAPPSDSAPASFEVRLARSGGAYIVPENKTIVEALAEHGVRIVTSCEQGVCGTCMTGVIEGVPEHRDLFLTDAEKQAGDQIIPCVSRSRTPVLVLNL
jgi:vanillate O-demethylase ferredoxin subunit